MISGFMLRDEMAFRKRQYLEAWADHSEAVISLHKKIESYELSALAGGNDPLRARMMAEDRYRKLLEEARQKRDESRDLWMKARLGVTALSPEPKRPWWKFWP